MNNIKRFSSRKEVTEFLKEKGIDTSNWTEEKWQSINKSQAEIHIQALAEAMWDAMNESTPKQLKAGEWHIPNLGHEWDTHKLKSLLLSGKYNDDNEITPDINEIKLKISTAHCARISYTTLGNNPKIDYEADIKLHDRLLESKHASTFEHCAKVMSDEEYQNFRKGYTTTSFRGETRGWCNNYRGFIQYRYLIENQ